MTNPAPRTEEELEALTPKRPNPTVVDHGSGRWGTFVLVAYALIAGLAGIAYMLGV